MEFYETTRKGVDGSSFVELEEIRYPHLAAAAQSRDRAMREWGLRRATKKRLRDRICDTQIRDGSFEGLEEVGRKRGLDGLGRRLGKRWI